MEDTIGIAVTARKPKLKLVQLLSFGLDNIAATLGLVAIAESRPPWELVWGVPPAASVTTFPVRSRPVWIGFCVPGRRTQCR